MNDKPQTSAIPYLWLVLILQVIIIAFLVGTRLIDADTRERHRNNIALYKESLIQYTKQAQQDADEREEWKAQHNAFMTEYQKTTHEYDKQKARYDALLTRHEKAMDE